MNSLTEIKPLIEHWMQDKSIFLVDIKLSPGKLIVYADKPAGISLDECAELNRFLFHSLDESGFNEQHTIEVSSPGIEYPFKVRQQFEKNIGRTINITTTEGEQAQGILESMDDKSIILSMKKTKNRTAHQKEFLFEKIREAKAVITFNQEHISHS